MMVQFSGSMSESDTCKEVEDVGEVGESSDEITNGVIITESSTLVVLFRIELG